MMSKTHPAKSLVAAFVTALALAACGGGGSGGGAANGANGSTGGMPTGFSGQDATAPVFTNNVATDGFNWINYRRAQAGVGVLARNSMLDRAAQAHSDYQRMLNGDPTHDEDPAKPGFTGATVGARVQAAGYTLVPDYTYGEIIAASSSSSGFYMAEELVTAIYHRFAMFEPKFKDMGSGSATGSGNYTYFTTDFGATRGFSPGLPRQTIVTWPVNGQTGVQPSFASNSEEPDPVPNINDVGYPVSIHANLTEKVTVQSFTVRARGGANLATRLLVEGLDPNTTMSSVAAIVPLAPLAANTTYDVSFTGTVGGATVSKSWSFTTK
jgi:uncharacterized protein YkwD